MSFWASGIPWDIVNRVIDRDFDYVVSPQAQQTWEAKTGHKWANFDDPAERTLECPWCRTVMRIPWTSCNLEKGDAAGR